MTLDKQDKKYIAGMILFATVFYFFCEWVFAYREAHMQTITGIIIR